MNKPDVLSKIIKLKSLPLVVAENLYGNNNKYILVQEIETTYNLAKEAFKLAFFQKHQRALGISDNELERMRTTDSEGTISGDNIEAAIDGRLAEKMMSSNQIVDIAGERVQVIPAPVPAAILAVLKFYPPFLLISEHYLNIRGGRKLMDDTNQVMKAKFTGVVPGRWSWNIKGRKHVDHQSNTPEVDFDIPEIVPLKGAESENLTQIQESQYDGYFD